MYHKKSSEADESQTLHSYEITESKETKSKNNSKKSMSVVSNVCKDFVNRGNVIEHFSDPDHSELIFPDSHTGTKSVLKQTRSQFEKRRMEYEKEYKELCENDAIQKEEEKIFEDVLQFQKKVKTKHVNACNLNVNEIIKSMKSKEKEIKQLEAKLEKNPDEKLLKKLLQMDNKAFQAWLEQNSKEAIANLASLLLLPRNNE